MMIVAKFGGSSLANAGQIKKVAAIIQGKPEIKAVVVSAPGKRFAEDIKVTDLLIALFDAVQAVAGQVGHQTDTLLQAEPVAEARQKVLDRYASILIELGLSTELLAYFEDILNGYMADIQEPERLLDALKACGEDFNAQVISHYLVSLGLDAHYVSPKEAGILVTDEPSNARLFDESYAQIAKLRDRAGVLIIPGFFGYSKGGDIVTFSRGGSDISGAIIANGLGADLYENYTDESFIYSMHPGKIARPHPIKEITYSEMRELSYAGFGIFHEEALEPVYRNDIPVMIRNTNQPEIAGTKIVSKKELDPRYPVTGVSSATGFTAISISKYLLNREMGFMRRAIRIFEEAGVPVEHVPSGIDSISLVIRSANIQSPEHLAGILATIQDKLNPDSIHVEDDLCIFAIVGEAMRENVGVAAAASRTFADNHINIRMISQGASEISMLFMIKAEDEDIALQGLYQAYFPREALATLAAAAQGE